MHFCVPVYGYNAISCCNTLLGLNCSLAFGDVITLLCTCVSLAVIERGPKSEPTLIAAIFKTLKSTFVISVD